MDTDKAIFMKILIVEDEPSLRELMQKTLAKERYVVETAGTFHEASLKIADYSYTVSYSTSCCQMGTV